MRLTETVKTRLSRLLAVGMTLCLCASMATAAFATEISTAGGSGDTAVTLSSTADGTLDGEAAATALSVTVPTSLPIAVGTDGSVTTATNAQITNNSYGPVKVSSATITAEDDWSLLEYGADLSSEKVDSNQFGFAMTIGGGEELATDDAGSSRTASVTQTLLDEAITGCYMSGVGDTDNNYAMITYDANVTALSTAVTNSTIASIVFVVEWDT